MRVFEKLKCRILVKKKPLIHKTSITYYLVHALFFDIVTAIVEAFKSGYKLLYPTVMEVYRLLSKPHFN